MLKSVIADGSNFLGLSGSELASFFIFFFFRFFRKSQNVFDSVIYFDSHFYGFLKQFDNWVERDFKPSISLPETYTTSSVNF
ncbi:hypothetical protein LRB67_05185 [Borreliella bissettiae]|uniref:hypothetical protein n=1 Tax=Borrelia bissettiae TaxID=64897 RepID=UPI001E471776|nr:hypothetical protein [Borreliella bissettiae]MCD2401647.1 hypothetical protein [Borreliella bissettiae]